MHGGFGPYAASSNRSPADREHKRGTTAPGVGRAGSVGNGGRTVQSLARTGIGRDGINQREMSLVQRAKQKAPDQWQRTHRPIEKQAEWLGETATPIDEDQCKASACEAPDKEGDESIECHTK